MPLDQLAGWFPAVVFPTASFLQLLAILRAQSAQGVSIASWVLFALANICLYAYIGRYAEPQAILSGLGTATVNVAVVITALRFRGKGGSGVTTGWTDPRGRPDRGTVRS